MKKYYFEEAVLETILFDSDVITDSSMSNPGEVDVYNFTTSSINESSWANNPVNIP